jgi:hypothetical protein
MPDPVSQAYVPATKPVTRDEVFDACNRLQAAGAKVTQTAVREALGKRGSMATISPLMRDWRASLDLLADDDEEGGSTGARPAEQEGGPTVGEERESQEEEPRQRPVEGRMALTVKDYEDRRTELTTQVHAQVEKYFRELITVERTSAMHAARLEEREAAAKAIQQAEKSIKEAAAAEIEASVTRERERAIETLAQLKQVATAERRMWIVVATVIGILVGGGGVYVATARVSLQRLDEPSKEAITAPTELVPGVAPAAPASALKLSVPKTADEEVAMPAPKQASEPGQHKASDGEKPTP